MKYGAVRFNKRSKTGMQYTINNTAALEPTPREALQRKEEGTLLDRLLKEAVTPEEHLLLNLIDVLVDDLWVYQAPCEKAHDPKRARGVMRSGLRARLRQMFTGLGYSERRFYAAFHGIEKRMETCV